MSSILTGVTVIAADGVPPGTPVAVLAAPIGIIVFIGSIYLLVRSNLGTRRGYLVTATAMFGFLLLQSLFWTFGAPGTPQATGPTSLPGMPADAYQPTWTPFAETSRIAEQPAYADLVAGYPEGFEPEVPAGFADEATAGAEETLSFFAEDAHGGVVEDTWELESVEYAVAENGFPVIAVTFLETDETLEVAEGGEEVTLFAFFDEGAPIFPGILMTLASLVLFLLHIVLLFFDEQWEKRDLAAVEEEGEEPAREPVPAGA